MGILLGTMFDFYDKYLKDFGELLTDMERIGIKVDTTGILHFISTIRLMSNVMRG